jgi:hypothetical protein
MKANLAVVALVVAATWTLRAGSAPTAPPAAVATAPDYDPQGALVLPKDFREWVMVGGSLGLGYGDAPPAHEMFAHTLMEPAAYRHFVDTGSFREGTMFALVLQGTAESVLPARRGLFASTMHGVEMSVKDSSRPGVDKAGWAYYAFNGTSAALPRTAAPAPKNSCLNCHAEHARRDHVFIQFYPLLSEAAGDPTR